MRSASSSLLKRLVALVVLLVAGYLVLRLVVGAISGILTTLLVIAALIAVVWAYSALKRR